MRLIHKFNIFNNFSKKYPKLIYKVYLRPIIWQKCNLILRFLNQIFYFKNNKFIKNNKKSYREMVMLDQ